MRSLPKSYLLSTLDDGGQLAAKRTTPNTTHAQYKLVTLRVCVHSTVYIPYMNFTPYTLCHSLFQLSKRYGFNLARCALLCIGSTV